LIRSLFGDNVLIYGLLFKVNSSTGKWEMCGPFKVLVDKESAVQCNSHRSDILPINKSHSEMVKFREGSEDYSILARYIFELIEDIALGSQDSAKLKARQRKPNSTSWSSLDDPPSSDAEKGRVYYSCFS